jgi:hypothetical protein
MTSRTQYDIPTAVTFLMAGLGIGSILAILFSRHSDGRRWNSSATLDREYR